MTPRRKQKVVSFRSDYVAERLAAMAGGGRSQAAIVEEMLESANRADPAQIAERRRVIEAILDRVVPAEVPTITEFDAGEYGEHGSLA